MEISWNTITGCASMPRCVYTLVVSPSSSSLSSKFFLPLQHSSTCKISCCWQWKHLLLSPLSLLASSLWFNSQSSFSVGEDMYNKVSQPPPLTYTPTFTPPIPNHLSSLPVNLCWSSARPGNPVPVIFSPINPEHSSSAVSLDMCGSTKRKTSGRVRAISAPAIWALRQFFFSWC